LRELARALDLEDLPNLDVSVFETTFALVEAEHKTVHKSTATVHCAKTLMNCMDNIRELPRDMPDHVSAGTRISLLSWH
jgi:hypothetical protein